MKEKSANEMRPVDLRSKKRNAAATLLNLSSIFTQSKVRQSSTVLELVRLSEVRVRFIVYEVLKEFDIGSLTRV